ncbi:MAG: hypothetical protein AAFU83_03145, partial [Bacteroidota bacterium]
MRPIYRTRKGIALVLLVSLLIQSCGVGVPTEQLQDGRSTMKQSGPIAESREGSSDIPELQMQSRSTTLNSSPSSLHHPPSDVGNMVNSVERRFSSVKTPPLESSHSKEDTSNSGSGVKGLNNVRNLVKSFNESGTYKEADDQWFKAYVKCFNDLNLTELDEAILADYLEEYKLLAHIRSRFETKQHLRDYWHSVLKKLSCLEKVSNYRGVAFMKMTAYVLQHIDPSIFRAEDVQGLIDILSDYLLVRLSPEEKIFTKATCTSHVPTLESMYHIFRIIQTVDPSKWTSGQSSGLYQRLKCYIGQIAKSTIQYP